MRDEEKAFDTESGNREVVAGMISPVKFIRDLEWAFNILTGNILATYVQTFNNTMPDKIGRIISNKFTNSLMTKLRQGTEE